MADAVPNPALFKVETRIRARWGDLDALAHVNNARYFSYFEEARFDYLTIIAPGLKLDTQAVGPILARTHCNYLLPVGYPATLVIGTRVTRVGSTSFEVEHLVRDAQTGAIHAVAGAVIVWFDYAAGAKVALPPDLRARIRDIDGL